MSKSRVIELRQELGWTQERLADEAGVGLRTVQRLEAGHDASSETLTLIADALRVSVRDLFESIDDDELGSRVESLQGRVEKQQAARDRVTSAWWWLYVGVGIVVTMLSFALSWFGIAVTVAYWAGVSIILSAVQRIYLEPRLEEKYPLSKSKRERRSAKRGRTSVRPGSDVSDSGDIQ
ncbi:MAG: helix-turn-helix transcriptional regulator [Brevibacterium yomogidense]